MRHRFVWDTNWRMSQTRHVVTKAVENLAESPNSIIKILDRIREKDVRTYSYRFAVSFCRLTIKTTTAMSLWMAHNDVRDWLDQHPNSTIDIVTNSVLTSANSSTQAVIDVDLAYPDS